MDIDSILSEAERAVAAATDERSLDEVRVRYLGKKGELDRSAEVPRQSGRQRSVRRPVLRSMLPRIACSLRSGRAKRHSHRIRWRLSWRGRVSMSRCPGASDLQAVCIP